MRFIELQLDYSTRRRKGTAVVYFEKGKSEEEIIRNINSQQGDRRLFARKFIPSPRLKRPRDAITSTEVADIFGELKHNFKWKSCYGDYCSTGKEPEFTTFAHRHTGTLDYIFYEKEALTLERICELPSTEALKLHKGLPSPVWGSDHLLLCANFSFL